MRRKREEGTSNGHINSWQVYLESLTVMAQSMQRNCMFAVVNGAR